MVKDSLLGLEPSTLASQTQRDQCSAFRLAPFPPLTTCLSFLHPSFPSPLFRPLVFPFSCHLFSLAVFLSIHLSSPTWALLLIHALLVFMSYLSLSSLYSLYISIFNIWCIHHLFFWGSDMYYFLYFSFPANYQSKWFNSQSSPCFSSWAL